MNAQIFHNELQKLIQRGFKEGVFVEKPTLDITSMVGILEWEKHGVIQTGAAVIQAQAAQKLAQGIKKPGDVGFQMPPGGRG